MTIDEEIAAVEEVVDAADRAATAQFGRSTSWLPSDVTIRYKEFLDGTLLSARSALAHARQIVSSSGVCREEGVHAAERILASARESVRLMYVAMTVIERLGHSCGGTNKSAPRACSFCGKSDAETTLVAGPAGNICGACTRLACGVLGIQVS